MVFKARVLNEIMNVEGLGKGGRARRRSKKKKPVVLEGNNNAFSMRASASRKKVCSAVLVRTENSSTVGFEA